MTSKTRLNKLLQKIDATNSQDPNKSEVNGQLLADEVLYAQRMSQTLAEFNPEASELLQIAVRAQHIERWVLARSDFPEGRSGYKKWRSQLALHHAKRTGELMASEDFSVDEIERVKYLLLKRSLKKDGESQCLEDVACLVFLKWYFAEFAQKHSEDKLINILQLSWKKMSEKAHSAALNLEFGDELKQLVLKALS